MLLIIIGFILLAIIDLIPLVKLKAKKGIRAFIVLFSLALILGLLSSTRLEIPTIAEMFARFFEKIGIGYKD